MKHTRIILLIALLGAAACGPSILRGATITVTEVGDGLNVHTNLRQALADANDGDTIEFDPLIGGRNLPLSPAFGELLVNKSVTIKWVPTDGNSSYLGVDAGHACRVFHISPGKTVNISGLTITNGSATGSFGAGSTTIMRALRSATAQSAATRPIRARAAASTITAPVGVAARR